MKMQSAIGNTIQITESIDEDFEEGDCLQVEHQQVEDVESADPGTSHLDPSKLG